MLVLSITCYLRARQKQCQRPQQVVPFRVPKWRRSALTKMFCGWYFCECGESRPLPVRARASPESTPLEPILCWLCEPDPRIGNAQDPPSVVKSPQDLHSQSAQN